MTTKLDILLTSIDPDKSMEKTLAQIDRAINFFRYPSLIDNWNDFRQCLSRFLCHSEACVLRLRRPMDDHLDHYWDQAFHSMHKIYGPNGEKAAFEMARTGNQGGLYAVLKAVAKQSAEQYSQNEINARVSIYWQELSLEEKLAAPIEYIEKFGNLLPSELTEASAARIRAKDFQNLIKAEDVVKLKKREAFVRCGTEIVKIRTIDAPPIPQRHFRDEIIALSRQKYCKPVAQVQRIIERRGERLYKPYSPLVPDTNKGLSREDFEYEQY